MIVGYFHVAMMNGLGGLMIANEMHGRIMQSGLYARSDLINVVVLGPFAQAEEFFQYVLRWYPKYRLLYFSENLGEWEWPSLMSIQADCHSNTDEYSVWYCHTKGSSNCRPDVPDYVQKNVRNWRSVMCHEFMNVDKAQAILDAGVGATGPLYAANTLAPSGISHFCGNFWWARASHIRTLPVITPELRANRNHAEAWIGTGAENLGGMSRCNEYDLYDFSCIHAERGGPLTGMGGSF